MPDHIIKLIAKIIKFYRKLKKNNYNIKEAIEQYEYPDQINIETSTACNFNCKMCSLQEFHKNKKTIDPKIFTKLDDVLRKITFLNFGFTGETLLHKNIIQILNYIKTKYPHLHTGITTNGSLLTKEISESFVKLGLDNLSISLDATNKTDYEKIRKGGKWETTLNNIKTLNEIKKQYKTKNPKLVTNFVAFKDNIHLLNSFIELAKELNFKSIRLTNVEPYTKDMESKVLFGENYTKEVEEVIKKAKIKCDKLNIDFAYPKFHKNKHKKGCDYLEPYITIDGDVIPCGQFTYKRTSIIDGQKATHPYISFGNIYNQNFDEIYYSKKYTEFRQKLKKGKWPLNFCKKHCLLNDDVLCPK